MMKLFNQIAKINIYKNVDVTVYRSTRSKLRIAIANVPGPMVRGEISFVTETTTDDGLPHTLEHLVFMGSERYPYKGFLDVIANRCLASGTNAATEQDHTAYSLTTAGSCGFLKTLPVFIDHLLAPLLTDSQYLTEVHHIDGTGADSGVVYSEMQDLEMDMESIVDRRRKELVYPPGSSYAASSGGRLAEIREMCSAARFITISGSVDHDDLLNVVAKVEEPNINLIPDKFERPFSSRTPAIRQQSVEVTCPADDETSGLVEISWLGSTGANVYKNRALLILFDYLTSTSAAPLKRDFVQIADPYCSSVDISLLEQTDCEIIASFEDVPTSKLYQIRERFFNKTVADHYKIETFDMERLRYMIDQKMRSFRLKLENSPHSFITDAIIGHQLYGPLDVNAQDDLSQRLQELQILKRIGEEPAKFWHKLFIETFTQDCVCVCGKPSISAVDEMIEKENKRIAKQIEQLGDAGLEKKKQILINAANEPTAQILNELIVKDMEDFRLIPVFSHIQNDWPVHTTWHEISSDFYEANTLIDTHKIPSDLRKYLMLWAELMFQSGAIINDKKLTYDEVAKEVVRDLVSFSISIGIAGLYTRFATIQLRVDADNYHKLAEWTQIFLKQLILDKQRVLICAKKLANTAAEYKRDGNTMAHFLSTSMIYDKNSNVSIFDYIGSEKFHQSIAKDLENGREEFIMQRLSKLNDYILSSLVNIHLVGDKDKLPEDRKQGKDWTFLRNQEIPILQQCDSSYGQTWNGLGQVMSISVGGSESAFLLRKAKFEGTWTEPTTMPALLLSQYLCQSEGPLWNAVRGNGLAYDASIYIMPDRNTIALSLYRCSKLTEAYQKVRETVISVLDGELDETQFEAAKRSLVCELVGGQSTIKSTAVSAILAIFRQVNTEFTKNLCAQIWDAKREDVIKNGSAPIRNLFNDAKSVTSIATSPNKMEEVKKLFPKVKIMKLANLQLKVD